ncbi:hypothetical protein [Enterobacter roggenkampii]|uniref:hypothetical protein n=1 Tax=Enterobacter roggenkampii TaxID=1812935 RepID=UPI0018AB8859|nr:hypothetical protein [Enterobacter roggenkampii]
MKNVKYWYVRLYQIEKTSPPFPFGGGSVGGVGAGGGSGAFNKLLCEGYSMTEVALPPRDATITLLTHPHGAESKTFRADIVDSIVCTPVYGREDEAKTDSYALENIKSGLSKNTHLLKSEFFTIECDLPTPEELDKIFAQLCEEFEGTPLSCLTFPAFFNEIVERTKGLTGMKMNVKPECMFSQNALRGKSIRPKH